MDDFIFLIASPMYSGLIMFVVGALWGSFANVVIHRLPLKQSVVSPRSSCPKCKKSISFYDNIPVLSWLLLLGKCRNCKAKISWRYPLVELIMGGLFCALYFKFGWSWTLLELAIFCFGLVVVSFIDFDHMIIPDSFSLSGIVLGLVGAYLSPEREFMPALWGVLMGGGFLWAVAYLYFLIRKEDGMGGGDIKLLGWIGAYLSWTSVPFVILLSSIIGSIVGLSVAMVQKSSFKTTIPFGPYLALAAVVYIFWGVELADWYMGLFLPSLISLH